MIPELRFRFTPNPALTVEIGGLAKLGIEICKLE
jgi:hypothetical protein